MKIINIGDELLIGQVTNFNASFMGEHLSAAGFVVDETIIIGDNAAQIWKSIEYAFQETEVVILTGGLGPTKDDITKEVICRYFNTRLVMHDETLDFISDMLGRLHIPMSKINYRQALVPEIAKVLVNRNGTAPGLWIEQEGKILIALPGVPYEMQALMTESVIPLLVEKMTRNQTIIHKVVQLAGIGESTLSDLIEPWEISLPSYIKLAYLPRPGIIRLRLTGIHPDKELLEKELQSNIEKLKEMVEEYIFSYEDDQMEEVVAKLFRKNRKQLSIAESCTG
ncbi:MAG: molybdopterin-binding protein, partial [Bacteroidales bacterium]